jgi:hypothetical protein
VFPTADATAQTYFGYVTRILSSFATCNAGEAATARLSSTELPERPHDIIYVLGPSELTRLSNGMTRETVAKERLITRIEQCV